MRAGRDKIFWWWFSLADPTTIEWTCGWNHGVLTPLENPSGRVVMPGHRNGPAAGLELLRQPPRIDVIPGENDHHRPAAHLAVVVHFRRHLVRMRHGDFKNFKAGRAGGAEKAPVPAIAA